MQTNNNPNPCKKIFCTEQRTTSKQLKNAAGVSPPLRLKNK